MYMYLQEKPLVGVDVESFNHILQWQHRFKALAHTHTHTCTHTHTHTHTHKHTHKHTRTNTHKHTRTNTHKHTHAASCDQLHITSVLLPPPPPPPPKHSGGQSKSIYSTHGSAQKLYTKLPWQNNDSSVTFTLVTFTRT